MEIPTKLLFDNPQQNADFSLYQVVVYYLLYQTLEGKYAHGYDLYFKLFPEQRRFVEYRRLQIIKGFWGNFKNSHDLGDNPLVIFENFDIYIEEYKAAAALALGVPNVKVALKKKRPEMTACNREWLISHYNPAEVREIEKARDELAKKVKLI